MKSDKIEEAYVVNKSQSNFQALSETNNERVDIDRASSTSAQSYEQVCRC